MSLKVIELLVDDAISGDTRVEEIALVLQPAIETEFVFFGKETFQDSYSDYPESIKNNAKKVLTYVEENGWGSCGTAVGKQRASQLAKGEPISIDTIQRMYSYLSRHKADLESSKSYDDGCGLLMYDAWGGAEALPWAERKLRQVEEEMGYDLGSLSPWAQTSGTTLQTKMKEEPCWEGYVMVGMKEKDGRMVPNCVPETKLSAYELDVFGYKTKYFYICPGAQGTFKEIISVKPTENSIGMIRSAAVVADKIFEIESIVLKNRTATEDQLNAAKVLVEDFKDIIAEIEKIQNKKFDVSYMDGHIETIASYVGKQEMDIEPDCGCGCWDDGTYQLPDNQLYFGTTMINGMPVFESADEAATYAQTLGCNGSHPHIIDGKEYYMPCEIHGQPINEDDQALGLIEDTGVELEDLLREGWTIVGIKEVDEKKVRTDFTESSKKFSKEQFYTIVSKPNEPSILDTENIRRRFVYMVGTGPDLIRTSREFCRRMLGGRQFVFRIEDLEMLNAQISADANNMKIIPRPKGTPVDLITYKGGANCRHYFLELLFQRDLEQMINNEEEVPLRKLTNDKRKMREDATAQIPASAQSGQVNPPVDYGSRSPKSVGLSKQSSRSIIVDIDDTLIRGGAPIKKTLEYVNDKWEDHRIIIVSARQNSRLGSTRSELERAGVKFDEIYLSDFPEGPNAARAFKAYKAKWLLDRGYTIVQAIENDFDTRREYRKLGIDSISPTSLSKVPDGFLQGFAVFRQKEDAVEYSEFCGCGGYVEEVPYLNEMMFQACGYSEQKFKKQEFKLDGEKRMVYSPAMKPGILIPRIDEATREKYFVTFRPETIERMAQRYMIDKRSGGGHTNYEHSELKFEDVYLVESWIVDGEQDKAYSLGYTKEQVPKGSWMVGFRVDSDEVWDMVKKGDIKGISIEGNFEYKFSSYKEDEYLLKEIINIINQIK